MGSWAGGAHCVCLQEGLAPWDPESGWAAFSEGCLAWGHWVFSAIVVINETYSSAGFHIRVIQLEFSCSTVAPTLELSAAFSCAASCWVCPVRGTGIASSGGSLLVCQHYGQAAHKALPSPWGKEQ